MKRAEVWKCRWCGRWAVTNGTRLLAEKHTHQKALAHALAEVGLTEKNTEKETNR